MGLRIVMFVTMMPRDFVNHIKSRGPTQFQITLMTLGIIEGITGILLENYNYFEIQNP